ncbi:hypothetical protein HYALB_00008218 [Hymenoscyphus albidus]|uniref:Aminoglycoside phosphotransferase domain-containing protein n=1 Tax=Hymenoscyphus albidus TaxID=595503 RepID=A0A9N9LTS0_9HELO|nr:hypothetical protein HYALB_00008218 [Hymenoscyphus albidus]
MMTGSGDQTPTTNKDGRSTTLKSLGHDIAIIHSMSMPSKPISIMDKNELVNRLSSIHSEIGSNSSSSTSSGSTTPSPPVDSLILELSSAKDDTGIDDDDDDAASDAGSTCSSTYEFSQESFDTFKDKVIQLCHDIGYGEPSLVDRREGGSFNRIIGLIFGSEKHSNCILRIPRFPKDDNCVNDIIDEVSILQYIKGLNIVQVPSVLAYDFTTNNALESQYVLQEQIPGKQIQEVFYKLPICEKLQITTQVAEIITKLEATVLEKPGRLIGKRDLPLVSTAHAASDGDIVITGYRKNGISDLPMVSRQPIVRYICELLEHHKNGWDGYSDVVEMLDELQTVAKQMAKAGLIRIYDDENVLWHWDINSRNILIQPKTGTTEGSSVEWEITGVLDWDDAKSVPLVIARKPPSWIWFDEEIRTRQWTGDRDTKPERDLTDDELLIKAKFDQIMTKNSPSYMEDAYRRGPWLRRLAYFAFHGFKVAWDWDKQKKFVEQWNEFYESLNLPESDDEEGSEDGSQDGSEDSGNEGSKDDEGDQNKDDGDDGDDDVDDDGDDVEVVGNCA